MVKYLDKEISMVEGNGGGPMRKKKTFIQLLKNTSVLVFVLLPTIAFAWPVPDTGQDAQYGISQPSYTKLDENGNALPDNSTSWVTVLDNVTGLIWEMKDSKDKTKKLRQPPRC